jgi:hypothetical protein
MAIFRNNNYRMAYEDADGFGNNFEEDIYGGYGGPGGITSLPIQQPAQVDQPVPQPIVQPIAQPIVQPIAPETDYYAQQFAPDVFAQPVAQPTPQPAIEAGPVYEPSGNLSNIIVEEPLGFGPDFTVSAPVQTAQPVAQPTPQPIGVGLPALQPEAAPIGAALQPLDQVAAQDAQQNTGVFGLPSLAQAQPAQQPQQVQPVQPTGPAPEVVSSLSQQILGQGLTSKWSGEGYGSAEKNAEDMAKILAGIGITDIKQFGKIPDYQKAEVQYGVNGQVARQDEDGNYYIMAPGGTDSEGNQVNYRQDVSKSALTPIYGFNKQIDGEGNTAFEAVDPSKVITKDGQTLVQVGETFGNKLTGQAVPNTYSERQTGNFFGGTFAGKGNTGYGVQFDAQGNPIFYTQGASSNDLANIMKDLGPIGQIALAAATGGMSLPAQLATNAGIQLLAGGNLGDIVKGTALSYLGGQAGNLISGSSGITDLLGKTGSDIASKAAQQYVGSGGKADIGQALLGGALNTGINSVIGEIPGLDALSATDKNLTSNLIAAVATGTPIDQAIQNALVGKASSEARSAVAEARNAAPAPQTYEEMMAGIMPKTVDQPTTSPSNDEILNQIGYEKPASEQETISQNVLNLLSAGGDESDITNLLSQTGPKVDYGKEVLSPNELDSLKLMNLISAGGQDASTTDTSTQASDNLINKAVTDTLGTKTENAAEPATGKGKAMDEIDWSQIPGDFGDATQGSSSLADEIAKSLIDSGNASSLFSGDGGIDLSAFTSNAGDEDQAAPPPGTADLLKGIIYTDTGDPTSMMEKYYQRGIKYDLDESNLGNLSTEELERYNRMKSGDTSQYDEMAEYLRARPQDFGGADVTQYLDEFNKNFNPAGGFGSQYQTVGTNRVMINDDGTATILNPTTNESSYLNEDQVKALIKNGTLNSKASGYVASTGGKGTTPGGAKPSASTKTTTKPTAAAGKDNTGMIMALMAMMAMMNNKGGGSSSAASVIPALSANRSQLPYSPAGRPGAGGVNYFSPTTYTAKAAEGGLMGLAGGGMSNLGGYSDGGRLLRGPGDGVSDSIPATIGGKQPARLAEGEFVVPARIVSELGNGSTNAGAKKLYAMMDRVQNKRRKTKNVAANTKAHKYLPS